MHVGAALARSKTSKHWPKQGHGLTLQCFRGTLTFGTYFVPYGEACGFGDNQHGQISPSLLAAAEKLGYTNDLALLQDYYRRTQGDSSWKEPPGKPAGYGEEDGNICYDTPLGLLIDPDPVRLPPATVTNLVVSYPKQGWCAVADRLEPVIGHPRSTASQRTQGR